MSKPLLFLSLDVECDGPCPGLNNLLSIGVACFDTENKLISTFERNILEQTEFKSDPDTMDFWSKNKEAWDHCHTDQVEPVVAMKEFGDFLTDLKTRYKIMTLGWPINYDWMWIHYYLHRYYGSNPLGYSAKDIGSYAWAMSKDKTTSDIDDFVNSYADPRFPHTHKALDDALEQGAKFVNMWKANTSRDYDSPIE
jgi:hypothetical protein